MKKQKEELKKHAYMNFHDFKKSKPVFLIMKNGNTFKGEIVKEYTYEILFDRKVKDSKDNLYLQEMLIPKHSIDYMYQKKEIE